MRTVLTYPREAGNTLKFLYSLEADECAPIDAIHRRLPDGTLDLVFNLGAPVWSSRDGVTYEPLPDVVLTGLYPNRNFVRYTGAVNLVVAVLQPGAAHLFVKDRLEIFRECSGDAALIWGSEVYDILDQLRAIIDANQRHTLVERFLVRQVSKHRDEDMQNRILYAVKEIDQLDGNIVLPEIYRRVFMSERDFRRKFTEWVGMNPKQYAGIIRVKAFSKQYAAGKSLQASESKRNWQTEGDRKSRQTDLVANLGYTDGSHFRRDFQRIAGVGPGEYFGELGKMGERFMKIM